MEITKNTNLKVDDILNSVKEHFIAVRTNEDLRSKPNSKNVKFACNVRRDESDKGDPILKDKKKDHIPAFPEELKLIVSRLVYQNFSIGAKW